MSTPDEIGNTARQLFDRDEVNGVLEGSFYTPSPASESRPTVAKEKKSSKDKPTHYKVICISMYTDALGRLDEMVRELKSRGYTKANRSALIRHALTCVDLDEVPRGL
jgi:hypothetical protein